MKRYGQIVVVLPGDKAVRFASDRFEIGIVRWRLPITEIDSR